jgi:lipopolysaccharide transport system ATP-binding protein
VSAPPQTAQPQADVLIQAFGLSKAYPKVSRSRDRVRSMWHLLLGKSLPANLQTTVLSGVDLTVLRGQSVGVIGENGAGKSTLLKLLTGVIRPSSGSFQIGGSVGALIELGAGFHHEYTGRENLMLAGALHGFTGAQLGAKMEEIIAFADIGHYLDEPVKHYSSGMVVRLGFALLAARRPDLLITDEVLAVGDESFQKKCVRWTEDYLSGGGTLLLVSHSMFHIQKLCRTALWLRRGEVAQYGDVFDVTQAYLAYHEKNTAESAKPFTTDSHAHYQVKTLTVNGRDASAIGSHEQLADLHLHAELYSPDGRAPVILVGIVRADGTAIYGVTTDFDHFAPVQTGVNKFEFALHFPAIALLPGQYEMRVHALDPEGVRLFDSKNYDFTVRGESREFGMVRLPHEWQAPAVISGVKAGHERS